MVIKLLRKVFVIGTILSLGSGAVAKEPRLTKIHEKIEKNYTSVDHISATDFSNLDRENTVVFDVRRVSEFSVSHLEGAIQIDPEMSAAAFSEQYKDKVNGKTVVFYCSVGRRSSRLAERVDAVLAENDAAASYNLIGGLFQWSNDGRSMVSPAGQSTNAIHPYNLYWGRLIENKSAIQYRPSQDHTVPE